MKNTGFKDGLFPAPTSEDTIKQYLNLDDWTIYGALKDGIGGLHGEIILNREPYKCKKTWDRELTEREFHKVEEDLQKHWGYLDNGAITKWYKLDKDIYIYDEKSRDGWKLISEGQRGN